MEIEKGELNMHYIIYYKTDIIGYAPCGDGSRDEQNQVRDLYLGVVRDCRAVWIVKVMQ